MKNKKLSNSPDSSGIPRFWAWIERIAGRLAIAKPDISASKKSPHPPPSPKERELQANHFTLCNFKT
jgi:hypothetical protein